MGFNSEGTQAFTFNAAARCWRTRTSGSACCQEVAWRRLWWRCYGRSLPSASTSRPAAAWQTSWLTSPRPSPAPLPLQVMPQNVWCVNSHEQEVPDTCELKKATNSLVKLEYAAAIMLCYCTHGCSPFACLLCCMQILYSTWSACLSLMLHKTHWQSEHFWYIAALLCATDSVPRILSQGLSPMKPLLPQHRLRQWRRCWWRRPPRRSPRRPWVRFGRQCCCGWRPAPRQSPLRRPHAARGRSQKQRDRATLRQLGLQRQAPPRLGRRGLRHRCSAV